jgi:hypothetical protein
MMETPNTTTVLIAVDAEGTLSEGSLDGNIYLFDSNRRGGSTGEGTQALRTKVDSRQPEGTALLWNIMTLSPEIFVQISDIKADHTFLKTTKCTYEGSDVEYWKGSISKVFKKLPYRLSVKIGSCDTEFSWNLELIGN